ncbi:MAG: S1 RNA-binding domain-containing protein [Clostridiales bacterium]|nr:S1 RNA-binding domain-containing protein [Candidatus Equinaster intestinalis]
MEIAVGQIVEGKITGITNFGVFVDLGDNKTGLVHISEVAQTYVNDIKEHVKVNDVVKMKVLSVSEDGKISLSIKRAMEQKRPERKAYMPKTPSKPDSSVVWEPQKNEPSSFEEMMNRFKQTSEEKFSDLKRKHPDAHRTKRGAEVK